MLECLLRTQTTRNIENEGKKELLNTAVKNAL
jgi:hypothetical protein